MKTSYFYIIYHKPTNRRYVGSKWAKNANTDYFMTESGYKTSSSAVHKLIDIYGLDSFIIEDIVFEDELKIPFNDYQTVLSYETAFQHYFNCAKDPAWINSRNNNSSNFNFPLLDETIKEKHKEIMNSPELWDGIRKTNLEKYGVDHHSKTLESKSNMSEFWKNNKEGNNPYSICDKEKHKEIMNSPELWDGIRKTNLEKYGVDHHSKTLESKENYKKTCLEKYNVDNYSKTEQFKESMRGDNNPMKREDIKIKHSIIARDPKTAEKRNKTISEQSLIMCKVCGQIGARKSINRYHNDKCGIKETRVKKNK